MINIVHLIWVIPVSASIGVFMLALFVGGREPVAECSLCARESTRNWACHVHYSDTAHISYIEQNQFVFTSGDESLVFESEYCPDCKRPMEVANGSS